MCTAISKHAGCGRTSPGSNEFDISTPPKKKENDFFFGMQPSQINQIFLPKHNASLKAKKKKKKEKKNEGVFGYNLFILTNKTLTPFKRKATLEQVVQY